VQVDRFESSPIGKLVPISGTDVRLGQTYEHFAFVPDPLPATVDLTQRTYKLLSEADRAVGGLNAKAQLLPNPSLLVRPALTKEAVATSALEGTFAPLSDVLEAEYVSEGKRSAEVREIQNYVRAAHRGIELAKTLPICLNLIAQLQEILVHRTRGDSNDAGRLRERQVCIGNEGAGIEDSRYVPPPPGSTLTTGVDDWEKWVNAEDDLPLLVKAALAHYQFEALHPFSDGNGRLGRLIVTLQLMEAGVLDYPILNLSPWLEPRRTAYIDRLLEVSATGDFDPWISFFAQAVKARALAATSAIQQLLEVSTEFQSTVRQDGAKGRVIDLAGDLIGFPVLDVADAAKLLGVTYPAANSAVHRLVRLGILREVTGGTYGRIFRCERVYQILAEA
jgi:Fic family protein